MQRHCDQGHITEATRFFQPAREPLAVLIVVFLVRTTVVAPWQQSNIEPHDGPHTEVAQNELLKTSLGDYSSFRTRLNPQSSRYIT
jgi:hypothetical protein